MLESYEIPLSLLHFLKTDCFLWIRLKNMFSHVHYPLDSNEEKDEQREGKEETSLNKDKKEEYQSEMLVDEKKQIIWSILKQVAVIIFSFHFNSNYANHFLF